MAVGLGKLSNEYAGLVMGVDAPKTVWMALAVSFAQRCGVSHDLMSWEMLTEWETLHSNGIVPQKPRKAK